MPRAIPGRPRHHEDARGSRLAVGLIEPPSEAMWPAVPYRCVCPGTAITAMRHWVACWRHTSAFTDHAALCAAENDAHANTASRKPHYENSYQNPHRH